MNRPEEPDREVPGAQKKQEGNIKTSETGALPW